MRKLPTGTVTSMFADVEGSTDLAHRLGPAWPECRRAVLDAVAVAVRDAGGLVVDAHGDELFGAFEGARDAGSAAAAAHRPDV